MKIQKNEFKTKPVFTANMEEFIEKVVWPFSPQIMSRNITVYIAWKNEFTCKIKTDWKMYELILFSIIQNSVKYNQFSGSIILLVDCQKRKEVPKSLKSRRRSQGSRNLKEYIFETEIIDSGIGIEEDRQKLLFQPFRELRAKQNMGAVKDANIGMGLACSKEIVNKLGGDIILKESQRGLTVFAFKLPVMV